MADSITSQNIRNLINTWKSNNYKINYYTDIASTTATYEDITNTVSCVWDGQKYLIYNFSSTIKNDSDNEMTYNYLGIAEEFLSHIKLFKRQETTS